MDDKKVPVITVDEAISKLRLFQRLIASRQWEDKECVVALEMGIRALQQPQIIRCKDCKFYHKPEIGFTMGDCTRRTSWYSVLENEFCSLARQKDGDTT